MALRISQPILLVYYNEERSSIYPTNKDGDHILLVVLHKQ